MSTLKSSAENLTLNADGSNNDVIIQSNGSTLVTVDGSASSVGIGETVPLGKLHIKSADSGASAATDSNEVVIEGSGHSGINILSGTSSEGAIYFGDSGDNDIGRLIYTHNGNKMQMWTNNTKGLEIDSGGDVAVGAGDIIFSTAGKGICLGVTTNTDANTLDDYEEGTFTPVFHYYGGGWQVSTVTTAGYNLGRYTKIGNRVTFSVQTTGIQHSSGGDGYARIEGLPFNGNSGGAGAASVGFCNAFTANNGARTFSIASGTVIECRDGTGWLEWSTDASRSMYLGGYYEVA